MEKLRFILLVQEELRFYWARCNFLYINLQVKATCLDSRQFGGQKRSSHKSGGEHMLKYKQDRAAVTLYIKR